MSSILFSFSFNVSKRINSHRPVMACKKFFSPDIKKIPRFVSKPVSEGNSRWVEMESSLASSSRPSPPRSSQVRALPSYHVAGMDLVPRFGATSGGILLNTQ